MSKITCEQIEPTLSAYRDGELSDAERLVAEEHIAACASCQNRLIELDAVSNALKALPRFEPKVDYAANIEKLISAPPKKASPSRKPIIWGGVGIAAAAAVMLMVNGLRPTMNETSVTANSNTGKLPVIDRHQPSKSPETEVAEQPGNANDGVEEVATAHTDAQSAGKSHGLVEPNKKNETDSRNKPSNDTGNRKNSKFNPHLEMASRGDVGTDNVPVASGQSSPPSVDTALLVEHAGSVDSASDSNIVAVYETDQKNVTEELGITTDEDGLYAIKL